MSAPGTTSDSGERESGTADSIQEPLLSDQADANTRKDGLVSVIVPCYNGAAFLDEALKSALQQSYPAVEVVLVDDGSTDSSPAIAKGFPVRYIRQPNRGLAEARNAGIRESTGSYLVFLDADDRLKPGAIEQGFAELAAHPECAMAVGDHEFISGDGSFLSHSFKFDAVEPPYEALLKSNFIEMISSVIFRRSVFDELGAFNGQLRVSEDYDLYLRIARERPICRHSNVVAEYRMHGSNMSLNAELMLTTTLRVLQGQANYVRNHSGRTLAYREGVRSWRKQYGRRLVVELARSFPTLRRAERRRKLLVLAGNYPQGLLLFFLLRVLPQVAKRKSAEYSSEQFGLSAKTRR